MYYLNIGDFFSCTLFARLVRLTSKCLGNIDITNNNNNNNDKVPYPKTMKVLIKHQMEIGHVISCSIRLAQSDFPRSGWPHAALDGPNRSYRFSTK